MKNIVRLTTLISFLVLSFSVVYAQDELSGEIDKLESGKIEDSSVAEDPSESAADVEKELNEEFGIKEDEPAKAPEELPDELAGSEEKDAEPVVEETKSPEELDQVDEKEVQEFKAVEPPPPEIEDSLDPVEEEVVEEPVPVIDPEPVVREEPEQEAIPDDFEERMHRIYSQFYVEATSDTAWTQIAGEKIKETYTVQPGDTLWDISVTFFGNGHYWPKVWQMNDNITNPHLVSPGYLLKFVPGSIDNAPQLNIAGQEAEVVPGTTELSTTVEQPAVAVAEPVPVIPPPDRKSVPVLTDLPPSLPYIRGSNESGFDSDGFDIQAIKPKIQSPKVYIPSYLVEEKPEGVGKIVEMNEADDETATLYETVFVQMTSGATIGEKLVVYSVGDKVKDTNGETMGYPFIQEAEVQIQELVSEKKDIYKGIIIRSIGNAKVGSSVSRSKLLVGDLSASGVAKPIDAEVVGGNLDNNRFYLGFQDVIYLNKGAEDGVKEGQIFTLLKSVRDRKEDSVVDGLREQVAKIKILKTTGARSTAIVLHSNQFIKRGDFIGTQAKLPTPDAAKSTDIESDTDEETDDELESELE